MTRSNAPQKLMKCPQGRAALRAMAALALVTGIAAAAWTGVSAAVPVAQVFYVPFPETELIQGLRAIANPVVPASPVISITSITAVANSTIIYYDQWENGYDADITNPSNLYSAANLGGTQIWGDGNPSNGAPPGVPSDIINAGTVIFLSSSVPIPRVPTTILFDSADKFGATKPVAVSHSAWATGTGTRLAGAVEVFDSRRWGTDYRAPVGVNIPDAADRQMFEYTSLAIMAGPEGATVQIDKDADGAFETVQSLLEGQSYFVDGGVAVGGRVISDKPVQVDILTGDIGSTYESRDSALFPTDQWSVDYYTPVSTGTVVVPGSNPPFSVDTATTVWLYNPSAAPLSVFYTTRSLVAPYALTTTTLTVPGGPAGGYLPQVLPNGFGAHFASTSLPFYAFSTTDSLDPVTGGQAWDWGFTLIPATALTSQVQVSLGIGRDPTSLVNPTENGNPVWVTTVGNGDTPVTVYVDFDANPATGPLTDPNGNKYDVSGSLVELQRAKIYDPDGDQTGLLVYTLTPNVKLVAAWGQDPIVATIGEPGLDAGTSVPPTPEFTAAKGATLVVDHDHDGLTGAGDTLKYTIVVNNTSRSPVPDVLVKDEIPAGTTYVANSTFFKNAAGVTTQVPDDAFGTPFPLDGAGHVLDTTPLPIGGTYEVTFQVTVAQFADLGGRCTIVNEGTASSGGSAFAFKTTTPVCQVAHLIVIKHVINDNSGTKVAGDFTTTITGVAAAVPTTAGVEAPGVDNLLTPAALLASGGAYSVDEGAHIGYEKTLSADCTGTIALGETKTCIITNDDIAVPAIDIRKQAEGADSRTFLTGSNVPFTIVVTNTGNVTLTNVTVTDPLSAVCANNIGTLAAGASTSYTCTVNNVTAGYTNVATVTGSGGGTTVSDSDPSTVVIDAPAIDIRKQAEGADSRTFLTGSNVPFTIVVTNTGNVELTNVTVTDPLSAVCANNIGTLAVGASTSYTCTVNNVTAGYTNVATVTASGGGTTVTDNDPSTVVIDAPAIDIRKQAEGADSRTFLTGSNVPFTIVVTNTGNVALTNVTVTDPLAAVCAANIGTLAAGASTTYTCTVNNVTAGYTNVATVTGSGGGTTVTDSDPSTVVIDAPAIDIRKQAEGADSRTFLTGSNVPFTIVVTNTGNVALTNVTVTDPLSAVCAANIGTLAAGASTTYTCTVNNVTAGYTNVATVTGSGGGTTVTDSDPSTVVITLPPAQLRVVKTPDGGVFTVGTQTSFTIVVSNVGAAGAAPATNVRLTDVLPVKGGLTWTSATTTQGTCVNPIVGNALDCQLGTIPQGGSVTIVVKSPTTTPLTACQYQPNPAAIATADGGLLAQDSGALNCMWATYTQGGWGSKPSGNNPGMLLRDNFSKVFPGGSVTVGGSPYYLKFTSASAIEAFLPAGSTPGVLTKSATNPMSSSAGVFAGQVLALQLSVSFSSAGIITGGLESLFITAGHPLAGKTVAQVLAIANSVLAGNLGSLPAGMSVSQLNDVITALNQNYDGGANNNGWLSPTYP